MPYVLIQHNVAGFAAFEPVFDSDEGRRRRSGSKGGRLFRSAADPNSLVVLLEFDTSENAKRFAESYELREAAEWAGDSAQPRGLVLEEIKTTGA
jgi:hypothetical protein